MKDGQYLTEFSLEPVYKIQSIRREDAGVYQCVARNSVGSIFSEKVHIVVACKLNAQHFFVFGFFKLKMSDRVSDLSGHDLK